MSRRSYDEGGLINKRMHTNMIIWVIVMIWASYEEHGDRNLTHNIIKKITKEEL